MRARATGRSVFALLLALLAIGMALNWTPSLPVHAAGQEATQGKGLRLLELPLVPYHYDNLVACRSTSGRRRTAVRQHPVRQPRHQCRRHPRTGPCSTTRGYRSTIPFPAAHVTCRSSRSPIPSRFSHGFAGGTTDRHAMNLVNLRYHPSGALFLGQTRRQPRSPWFCCRSRIASRWATTSRVAKASSSREERSRRSCSESPLAIRAITKERINLALAQFLRATGRRTSRGTRRRSNGVDSSKGLSETTPRRRIVAKRSFSAIVPSVISGSGCAFHHDRTGQYRPRRRHARTPMAASATSHSTPAKSGYSILHHFVT